MIRCEFTKSLQGEYLKRWLFALGLYLGEDPSRVPHAPKNAACWLKHRSRSSVLLLLWRSSLCEAMVIMVVVVRMLKMMATV